MVLALFAGQPSGVQCYAIGLLAGAAIIDEVADRLDDESIEDRSPGWLAFVDRYGMRWQLSDSAAFLGAGTTTGTWLTI
jgi:hypothetical protein